MNPFQKDSLRTSSQVLAVSESTLVTSINLFTALFRTIRRRCPRHRCRRRHPLVLPHISSCPYPSTIVQILFSSLANAAVPHAVTSPAPGATLAAAPLTSSARIRKTCRVRTEGVLGAGKKLPWNPQRCYDPHGHGTAKCRGWYSTRQFPRPMDVEYVLHSCESPKGVLVRLEHSTVWNKNKSPALKGLIGVRIWPRTCCLRQPNKRRTSRQSLTSYYFYLHTVGVLCPSQKLDSISQRKWREVLEHRVAGSRRQPCGPTTLIHQLNSSHPNEINEIHARAETLQQQVDSVVV